MTALSDTFRQQMAPAMEDAATMALVEEACRIIDRLDHIDAIVTGRSEWIELMHFRMKNGEVQEVAVSLDAVLSEARQQAVALKSIMGHLGVGKADLSSARKVVDPLDELRARRLARGAGPAAHTG